MHYICPVCKTENTIDADFEISEYVCKYCSNLIDISKNISAKAVKKPTENVVLEVGQKGTIDGTDYTVTGIIIRKYGSTVFWREYYLKDKKGQDAFLSESDGHWVFLHVINVMDVKKKLNDKVAEFHMKNYRWYETTQCTIHAAAGFFEDSLNFSIANYKEYVNGTQMISQERSGSNTEFFFGKHISKYKVKKAFNILSLPNYSGIGIVQPFYVNVTQAINILAVSALIICLIQLYVVGTRTNALVFEQEINFADVADKEMVSKSFELSGGSAPLNVEVSSNVDNSWANVGLGLVNEKNNEIVFASKDIEQYHGYEDGENWTEGSQRESFNFCGVAPGNYHFVISAERQEPLKTSQPAKYISPDGNLSISREENGTVSVTNQSTFETISFGDAKMIKKDSVSTLGQLVHKILGKADIDSLLNANAQAESISATPENKSVKIKAEWLPVSFRNFVFVLLFLIALVLGLYFGRRAFERSKWFNSSNSPYTYS